MKLLLDTHILLWAFEDGAELSPTARDLLANETNEIVVSAVSIWEISIKSALRRNGRRAFSWSAAEVLQRCLDTNVQLLPVLPTHAVRVESLPLLHGDPFDRLLVAQALSEPLRLVTSDRALAHYSDTVILV